MVIMDPDLIEKAYQQMVQQRTHEQEQTEMRERMMSILSQPARIAHEYVLPARRGEWLDLLDRQRREEEEMRMREYQARIDRILAQHFEAGRVSPLPPASAEPATVDPVPEPQRPKGRRVLLPPEES